MMAGRKLTPTSPIMHCFEDNRKSYLVLTLLIIGIPMTSEGALRIVCSKSALMWYLSAYQPIVRRKTAEGRRFLLRPSPVLQKESNSTIIWVDYLHHNFRRSEDIANKTPLLALKFLVNEQVLVILVCDK